MKLFNLITSLAQIVTRRHSDLQNVSSAQHHIRFSLFEGYLLMFMWEAIDAWTKIAEGTGDVYNEPGMLDMRTGTVSGENVGIHDTSSRRGLVVESKTLTINIPILYGPAANAKAWVRISKDATYPPGDTDDHVGLYLLNGELFGSCADGSTQTLSDKLADIPGGDQYHMVKVVFEVGVGCHFYVNDDFKATIDTNLPTAGKYYIAIQFQTSVNAQVLLWLGRLLMENTQPMGVMEA